MNNLEALKVKPEVKPTNQGVKVISSSNTRKKSNRRTNKTINYCRKR